MSPLALQMGMVATAGAGLLALVFFEAIPGRADPKWRHAVFWTAVAAGGMGIMALTWLFDTPI